MNTTLVAVIPTRLRHYLDSHRGAVAGCAAFAVASFCSTASAQNWVQWPTNGHYYLAVYTPSGVTWSDARQQALALGGDLATITSAPENAFVFGLVSAPMFWETLTGPTRVLGPWLGGFQPPGTAEPLGGWMWVTGETWSYANWHTGEPNNTLGGEDNLQFYRVGSTPGSTWNDLVDSHPMRCFVVESPTAPPTAYCTAGTTTNSCIPSISSAGTPRVAASSGFVINVASVEGQKSGLVFYGISGRNAVPWGGTSTSFLCVKTPVQRMTGLNSGGTPGGCDGVLSIDWSAFVAANPSSLGQPLQVGQVVNAQGWFRDPPALDHTNLSDGLEFTLVP